jgi:hypothetical protein
MRGRTFVWLGTSAFTMAILGYCMLTIAGLLNFLSNFSLA